MTKNDFITPLVAFGEACEAMTIRHSLHHPEVEIYRVTNSMN